MEYLLWALVAAAVAVFEYVRRRRRDARRRALRTWADRNGLHYARLDLTGQRLWRPFRLFGMGDERGVENVVTGTLDGRPVELFDYWYKVVEEDRRHRRASRGLTLTLGTTQGRRERTYRFTCAVAEAPGAANWPHLSIAPESWRTKLADKAGFRDIEFESDAFNRMFDVRCDDRRFAFDVLDARLMQWLLLTEGRYEFELRDQDILCVADELDPAHWRQLALVLDGFVQRLPSTAVRRPTRPHQRPDAPSAPPPSRPADSDDLGYFA